MATVLYLLTLVIFIFAESNRINISTNHFIGYHAKQLTDVSRIIFVKLHELLC